MPGETVSAAVDRHREPEGALDWIVTGQGIQKSFRTGANVTPVLRSVDVRVAKGECLFLAGPSGSGKSTLLSIIGCILSADEGEVRILGHDVSQLHAKEQARFRREHIGFVFQKFHLFRGLTVRENVNVAFDLLGVPKRVAIARSLELLSAVGLSDRVNHHINQLSVGQCQRVAIARALAGEPNLILADEPTASLDAKSGLAAMTLLKDLTRQRGATCIVVTHDSRIFPMADRVITMEDGRIVAGQHH